MNSSKITLRLQRLLSTIALLFGLMTLFAGGRVLLLGISPGYAVFKPLLVFNFSMGFAYILVGVLLWRSLTKGRNGAAAIFGINLIMLVSLIALYRNDYAIAVESLRAMSFRTGLWLVIFVVTLFAARHGQSRPTPLH